MATDFEPRLKNHKMIELRKFGFSFAVGMVILAIVAFWRNFSPVIVFTTVLVSLFHLGSAIFKVELVKPTYSIVSTIGKILGRFITTVIFSLVYYFLFTPIALLLRLGKKDVIADNSRHPNWITILEKQNDPQRITRLY